jgi:5-methyltetrahydropteroyltriglutamate--homocysteine methyltransferase
MDEAKNLIIDDVGSFPLPSYTNSDYFKQFYWDAFLGIVQKGDIYKNQGLITNIIHPIEKTMQLKLESGIEIVNYPQLIDMYSQFLKPIKDYEQIDEPHLIQPDKAQILEVEIIKKWAKEQFESTNRCIDLKVCVTGPLEMYFKEIGFGVYKDMAMNLAKSVNSFLKNSIIDTPYLKTKIVAIDEPSLGYITINGAEEEDLIKIYDKSVENMPVDVQIHLHSLNSFKIPLKTKNINVLTCEFASNQQNYIDKKYLEEHDKFMRVGISRTNFNAIMADALDSGQEYKSFGSIKGLKSLIDSPARIEKNLISAIKQYGDHLKYIGPDCGLSAWGPPELAVELLKRTSAVVNNFRKK